RQGRVSNYLFRGGATVHSKRRSASSLLPVSAVRKHIHGSRKTGSQVRDGALGNGDGAVSPAVGFSGPETSRDRPQGSRPSEKTKKHFDTRESVPRIGFGVFPEEWQAG